MAQRTEMTVACQLFSGKVPTVCLDSGIVRPLRIRWVKGVCVFRCNLPPALLAERLVSFTCHCGNTGVKRAPNKSQHTKLTLEKNILPPFLPGFELATFRSRVRRSCQNAIPAPKLVQQASKRHVRQGGFSKQVSPRPQLQTGGQ